MLLFAASPAGGIGAPKGVDGTHSYVVVGAKVPQIFLLKI